MRLAVLLATAILIIFASKNFADGLPKGCAVEARAYQILHSSGCWTRLIRLEYGTETEGHAVCVFALANNDLWVYDVNTGSQKIETKSHALVDITKALGQLYEKIRSSRFMDDQ